MLSSLQRPGYLAQRPPARLADLATGDVVLFSGRTLAARLVQLWTGSYWSHVGLVVRLPEYGDVPLLWEATRASRVADIGLGAHFDGVQLVPLAEKLASYPGEVAVRRLVGLRGGRRHYQQLRPLVQEWHALPYSNFLRKQLKAWWLGGEAASFRRGGFCSEFVAEVYKHLQLLPPHKPSIDYLPRDFAPEQALPLLRGRLSPVYPLRP